MNELDSLFDILSHCRPHGSESERSCITKHLDSIPKMTSDGFGNRILVVGKNPTVMFSSHTDTVHREEGYQKLFIDEAKREVFSSSNCLGADDGAGMWLMLQMIKAGKRGLYVFHRGEEKGGLGSSYIRTYTPKLLEGIKYCIAFDRKGRGDVITHQFSGRGCSELFAKALARSLGDGWFPDSTGIFTDSDNYTDIIPECTNISVGYFNEHTQMEYLDYGFLEELSAKLRKVVFETLPVDRNPDEIDEEDSFWYNYGSGQYSDVPGDDDVEFLLEGEVLEKEDDTYWENKDFEWDCLYEYVINHPLDITDLLMDNGYNAQMLARKVG